MNYTEIKKQLENLSETEKFQQISKFCRDLNDKEYAVLLAVCSNIHGVEPTQVLERETTTEVTRTRAMYVHILRNVCKFTYENIAQILNITIQAVYKLIENYDFLLKTELLEKRKYEQVLEIVGLNK